MAKKAFIEQGLGKPPWFMRMGLNFQHMVFKFSRIPGMARRHPWVREDKTDMRFLPINQDISRPEDCPMPLELLDRLIEEASHCVIVDFCGCRMGYECEDYPHDIGCLLMGDSALEVPATVGREVGKEEAKEHARKAIDVGLVPIVGRAHVDNFIFGVKDRGCLLTVCFCCECCSITRFIGEIPYTYVDPAYPRLKGVSVEVTGDCRGCGTCAEHCFVHAIELVNNKAVIGEYCRACGRCASACPNGAITVRITDRDFLEDAYQRIRAHVRYD
ncbi:MAG: 4Fe-4S binding protein [Actinobacteria bacterium]|nr:4Fe-4S binding protein [Actinomycetota bacterium]